MDLGAISLVGVGRRARTTAALFSRAAAALLAATLCAASPPAAAQPPSEPVATSVPVASSAPATAAPPEPSVTPEERRAPAHYRGRENPTTPEEALAWIPRVVFFPVFVVTELGLRRPVYKAAEWTDRHKVVPILENVFNPTPNISWFPIVTLDLGANSSFGAKLKIKNLLVPGHDLRLSAETGGDETWHFTVRDRFQLGPYVFAGVRGDLQRIPNRAFFGLGPRSGDLRTNFQQTRGDAFAFAGLEYANHFRFELTQGYRGELVEEGFSPSVGTVFDTTKLPGFGRLDLGVTSLDVRVDSRRVREENSGARVLGNVTYARDFEVPERSFVTTEFDVEAALEVSYPDRVLAVRAYAMETFALGREPVPVSHLAMLGWQNHHGFIWGRFRGDSALLLEVQYRYPIAYYVDALWTASAGNVFGERFRGADVGALTSSLGFGLRTRRAGFGPVELMLALGSTRFEERFTFDSLRVYFGTTEGL